MEAKEGLEVRGASDPQGSITFQMLFKYYPKLSGMTVRLRAGLSVSASGAGAWRSRWIPAHVKPLQVQHVLTCCRGAGQELPVPG